MKIQAGSLKSYIEATNEVAQDHAANPPQLMSLIEDMDVILQREFFAGDIDVNPFVAVLMMNSYTLLLGAVRQALSGHVVTVFPVVRAALESACYAYLMSQDEARVDMWLHRHRSEEDKKTCRKIFTVANAVSALGISCPQMADYISANYEAAIDFGAHPNPRSVTGHLAAGDVDDTYYGVTLTAVYDHDHWLVNRELLVCVETGQAIAFLFSFLIDGHPLVRERLGDFNDWMIRKNGVAEELNGKPIQYSEVLYSSIAQPNRD